MDEGCWHLPEGCYHELPVLICQDCAETTCLRCFLAAAAKAVLTSDTCVRVHKCVMLLIIPTTRLSSSGGRSSTLSLEPLAQPYSSTQLRGLVPGAVYTSKGA